MNMEPNREPSRPEVEPRADVLKRKKRKTNKKQAKPGVVYGDVELALVEGPPFWNAVHDGVIKSIEEDGIIITIARDGGTIDVFVADEELLKFRDKNIGQKIRIYLEDEIAANATSDRPFTGSEIKAIELDLLDRAKKAKSADEAVLGYVVAEIKGGYSLALFADSREEAESGFGLRAFLPLGRTGLRRTEGLSVQAPQTISVQITELDPSRGNIVVSRREILEEERKKGEDSFFSEHAIGDEVSGQVTAVMPYGAFINLGPVDGFLHISDISWDKKPRLKGTVDVGNEIRAKIIEIDRENKKVKLSIKEMRTDPWQTIEKTYKPGSEVEGDIVAFADFGAFVKLKDGVEGLIHMGEITWNRIKHPSQQFKLGEHIKALVLRVDKDARRISLSTKALEMSPVERLSAQFPPGAIIKTKVASIHDFGLFVEMDESSNGLVPRSEVSWLRSDEPLEQSFSVGQEIEAVVLGYDAKRQRVTCSIKRTHEDPWPKWKNTLKRGSSHKVKVIEVKRAGVVCQLDKELSGFCPRSQLLEGGADDQVRSNIKVGDEIDVVVTALDIARQRVSLSQRLASETETKRAYESYLNEQKKSAGRTTLGDAFRNVNNLKGKFKDHG